MSSEEIKSGAPEAGPTATRILDIAEQLFAERGFAAVSVREIAGRVGLNQASLYNHFPSKQALYEAVLERGLRPILELLGAGAEALHTPEAGDALLERLVDQLWRTPHLPKLVQREVLDDGEYFERIAARWLRPIYEQGRRAMEAMPLESAWRPEEVPLVVLAMYHFLFGHFTSAAVLHRVIGIDPFSAEMRRVHASFLKQVSRRLLPIGPGGAA
jgi:TetR/AcrR family transcriptional regulator